MNNDQTKAMLSDILGMLCAQEKRGAINGPLAICLYHLTEDIVHEHVDAAWRNEPISTIYPIGDS